jgi:predicted glycosyltransferase
MAPRFATNGDGRAQRRLMFYSHDTYGLGHLRRTLTLARHLRAGRPLLTQLVVTGSPMAHRFRLPAGADYIKLPSVVKVGAERYEARTLAMPFARVRDLRRELILDAARHFRPDAIVVDNVPAGLKGELEPALRELKAASCRIVLGLRDVVDEPEWVRRAWARNGSFALLDEVYDRILVYGRRDVHDVAAEYGFSPRAAAKTRYVGYLRPEPAGASVEQIRADLELEGDRLVLVMAGGGGDGYRLLRGVLDAIGLRRDGPRLDCLLLGGPFMPPEDRRRVLELAEAQRSVRFRDFVDDPAGHIAAADVIVAMGGYNSVCELLAAGRPALVVPRVSPRREQLIRAEALSARGMLRMVHPAEATPERLLAEIERLLARPERPRRMPMDGLPAAAAELDRLLAEPAAPPFAAIGG